MISFLLAESIELPPAYPKCAVIIDETLRPCNGKPGTPKKRRAALGRPQAVQKKDPGRFSGLPG
jgi:hypothetical protein